MSNVFSFTGTVGKDAEVRYMPSGAAVLSVSVANNIGFGDKQQTMWFRVVVFGKRAEGQLQNYLKKGQQVFVSGEFKTGEYQAKDGTTKTTLEINATILDLIGKRQDGDSQPAKTYPAPSKAPTQDNSAPYEDDWSDDIPFVSLNSAIKGHLV